MSGYYRQFCVFAICAAAAGATTLEKKQLSYSSPVYYDSPVAPLPQQFQQGLPIIGALIPGLLGGGGNGLSTLVPLANLGQLLNLGGLLPGVGLPQTQQQQCSLGQISRCRCENLIALNPKTQNTLEIMQQKVSLNRNGEKEISARLNNDLLIYQRSGSEAIPPNNLHSHVVQGYYTLKISDNKYLSIYYTITDADYTVKADVTAEPPKNDLDESPQRLEF